MASTEYEIPDIKFLGLYYPQILQSLLDWRRASLPELSDESENEATIQLLKAFAFVGHQNNAIADLIAQESLLKTARLAESVREHLRQIGYDMEPARPAKVELLMSLTRQFAAPIVIAPLGAQASTERDAQTNVTTFFELDSQVSVTATEGFTGVYASEAGTIVDYTTEANDPTSPASDWQPWGLVPQAGDALYIGHDSIMIDRVDVFVTTSLDPGAGFGVWEFHNGDFAKAAPTSVTQDGNRLIFDLTSYLGTKSRAGTEIRVQLNRTTASEDAISYWTGDINAVEIGLLGQSQVSLDVDDYTVGSDWDVLDISSTSGTGDLYFGQLDEIRFPVPQGLAKNWKKTQLTDADDNPVGPPAFYFRFRWIEPPVSSPVVQYLSLDDATHYVIAEATQGQTEIDELVGSSSGEPNQVFDLVLPHMILAPVGIDSVTSVAVSGSPWTRVENFIASKPTDEHFVIELTSNDDTGQIKFGDGTRGKIPAPGASNIRATYRHGANENGNVGAGTVTKDRTSLNFVNTITNPRQASGWSAAEGSTAQSLELAKQLGPAVARLKGVAVSADDLIPLTLRYVDDQGASPFSRAVAVEESFGPNTVELVVLAKGSGLATTEQLEDLALFFNGDKNAIPPIPSRFAANQEVTATNCPKRAIDVVAKVKATGVTEEQIENALISILNPESRATDGSWEWQFGEAVERSRIDHEIHKVSNSIVGVELISPAANIFLQPRELPIAGSISIEVISP